jgi:hypothetical protein
MPRLGRGHAAADVLFGEHVQVEGELGIELPLVAGAPEQ